MSVSANGGIEQVYALRCAGCAQYFAGVAVPDSRPSVSNRPEVLNARAEGAGWATYGRTMCRVCQGACKASARECESCCELIWPISPHGLCKKCSEVE